MFELMNPPTQTELRFFLGVCNVSVRFPICTRVATLLYKKLQKGQPISFLWLTPAGKDAAENLEKLLMNPLTFALRLTLSQYTVWNGGCDLQLGCILLPQKMNGTYDQLRTVHGCLAMQTKSWELNMKDS